MLTPTFDTGATARPRLQIGDWCADPATNELSRGDEITRIEPKAMEVLMLLAQRAGQVVRREELFSAVWPDVVVGDEALTQSINKLRKALGDNARAASYIETISKRGYRLIAPVRQGDAVPPARDDSVPTTPSAPERKRWAMTSHGWVAAVVAASVLAAVYAFRPGAFPMAGVEPIDSEAEGRPAPLTVTVLPFESSEGDGEQAYLARGISDDLRTDLSRLPGLRVIRASGGARGSRTAPGARYLVSGSVRREAGTLRVNIDLIDTTTREQLWSERFERPFGDLFAVQDEIGRKLTQLLPGKVADAARQRIANRYTRSLPAYEDFLRGQALFLARQSGDNEEARGAYRKALERDPNFARAYAGLAMTYAMEYRLRPAGSSSPALGRAFELAESARLIDPDIAEVHWALGFVHAQSRRHQQAIASLQRAIELNPSSADAYALMGGIHTYIGQPAKSIPLLRTAMRLNPDGGYLYFLLLGRAYLFENDIEQAQINLHEAVARNPVDLETRVFAAAAAMAAGDRRTAEWEAEEIRSLEGGFSLRGWLETYPMTSLRQRERLSELLAKAGLQ